MAVIWDKERVGKLTLPELKNLLGNAEKANNEEIAEIVRTEIASRRVRTTKIRAHDIPRSAFEQLGRHLLEKYDLSTETAKRLSSEVKGFIAHNLLGKDGKAKVGGSKKMGNCNIDEYISYRLKDQVYAIALIQLKDDDANFYRYHVYGPPEYLENPRPYNDLRPDVKFDTFIKYGVEYLDFDGASTLFQAMIDKVAPKKD
jgi:hypothetical protein